MNKPITTKELFNKICNILKEKGRFPDILEYDSPTRNPVPITTYEYELGSKLAFAKLRIDTTPDNTFNIIDTDGKTILKNCRSLRSAKRWVAVYLL